MLPKMVMVCGAIFILVNFSIIGPLPFFPFKKSLGLIIGALVLQGDEGIIAKVPRALH